MKVNICASLVSLPAFVVANVRDNVRLQYLQDCCYYGIQAWAPAGIFPGGGGKPLGGPQKNL